MSNAENRRGFACEARLLPAVFKKVGRVILNAPRPILRRFDREIEPYPFVKRASQAKPLRLMTSDLRNP